MRLAEYDIHVRYNPKRDKYGVELTGYGTIAYFPTREEAVLAAQEGVWKAWGSYYEGFYSIVMEVVRSQVSPGLEGVLHKLDASEDFAELQEVVEEDE